ncbi:hypothetical protein DPMN_010689 [Dreissena polymorpha]|uniref:Uncharacterized protein n=1 Tax=Dreissena polymorpha TaxID=45954 RepID=A0A9D4N2Q5_DREPO|nr:hypothetical protein DPMN_010689 [Dreissena polymorpha]
MQKESCAICAVWSAATLSAIEGTLSCELSLVDKYLLTKLHRLEWSYIWPA